MDTQLSRFRRSMTAQPCRSSFAPFDGTISSERVAPTGSSRHCSVGLRNAAEPDWKTVHNTKREAHAKAVHNIETVPPEVVEKVRQVMREE